MDQPKIRTLLPCTRDYKSTDINLFELLKYNYGKDLSRITMPVWLCEPLSIVQK